MGRCPHLYPDGLAMDGRGCPWCLAERITELEALVQELKDDDKARQDTEDKLEQRIADLEAEIRQLQGYCSTFPPWSNKHPEEFVQWWRNQMTPPQQQPAGGE